jgi:hypothetical protein
METPEEYERSLLESEVKVEVVIQILSIIWLLGITIIIIYEAIARLS